MKLGNASKAWVKWLDEYTARAKNTKKAYTGVVRRWIAHEQIENLRADFLNEGHVHRYWNRQSDLKRSMRVLEMWAIKSFVQWMQNKGYTRGNPAKLAELDLSKLTHEQKEMTHKDPFTDEEFAKVYAASPPFWRAMMTIARETGLRLSDCVRLEWASVYDDHLAVWTLKSDRRVACPMTPELAAALETFHGQDAKLVFPAQKERDPGALSSEFTLLCGSVGVKRSFHCLRVLKLREAARRHGIEYAARLAGHRSARTTRRYYLADENLPTQTEAAQCPLGGEVPPQEAAAPIEGDGHTETIRSGGLEAIGL